MGYQRTPIKSCLQGRISASEINNVVAAASQNTIPSSPRKLLTHSNSALTGQ